MRLPVRPQVVSCSSTIFSRTSQRRMARERASCEGTVDSLGTMMLWVFMNEAGLRTAVILQFYRSAAQVATDQRQAAGQHQPGDQAHEGFAGQLQGQSTACPEADEHDRQQADGEQ